MGVLLADFDLVKESELVERCGSVSLSLVGSISSASDEKSRSRSFFPIQPVAHPVTPTFFFSLSRSTALPVVVALSERLLLALDTGLEVGREDAPDLECTDDPRECEFGG